MLERTFRLKSYTHLVGQIVRLVGADSIWDVNLARLPKVRSLAYAGRLDRLECLLASAKLHASRAGLRYAAASLRAKEIELAALRRELAFHQIPSADIVVLDEDWGRKGRGAKIMAWIVSTNATASQVMERFQLAKSTAQRYIRRCQLAPAYSMAA